MKRRVEAGDNNMNLLPIILLLVESAAAIIAMFVFPFFGVYFFFFPSTSDFQFAVVNKKTKTTKEKEHNGTQRIFASCTSSLQNHKSRFFLNKEEKCSVVAT
jgi:hypothetical protein